MRKFTVFLIILLCTHNLFAQQNSVVDIREVYISSRFFTGSNFGLQYKTGLNDNTLLRIALLSLNSEVNKTQPPVSSSFTERRFNINGGVEKIY